jgi:dTDP-4-dehydrorhamnose reductase
MRLLVTGAHGMLGRAVAAAARDRGHDVRALGRAELDVVDADAVAATVAAAGPEAVVNCAAWTDVDGAESEPEAALAVNGDGAGNVARAAAEAGAVMVHVSTDYVFSGAGRAEGGNAGASARPYVESDPTGPRSAYGRSKLAGEHQIMSAWPGHIIVRSSWLFGSGGRNFVDTMLGLGAQREEVLVVDDQVGCPTWTGHLAPALLELSERGAGGGARAGGEGRTGRDGRRPDGGRASGIYHVAGTGSCSWNELAREVFEQAGLPCRVLPTSTAATARPAPRPAYSVLASERTDAPRLPSWPEGVRAYLAERHALSGGVAR